MKLNLQTDYSLRSLMYLAVHPGRGTVTAIAQFFQISEAHVAKVAHQLAKLGFLRSIRGVGGGLELARPPSQISVGEVIQAVEGQMHLLDCVAIDNICVIQPFCRLRTVLAEAERVQMDYLKSIRLSDVLPTLPVPRLNPVSGLNTVSPAAAAAAKSPDQPVKPARSIPASDTPRSKNQPSGRKKKSPDFPAT